MPRAASRQIGRLVPVRWARVRCGFEALAVGDYIVGAHPARTVTAYALCVSP